MIDCNHHWQALTSTEARCQKCGLVSSAEDRKIRIVDLNVEIAMLKKVLSEIQSEAKFQSKGFAVRIYEMTRRALKD